MPGLKLGICLWSQASDWPAMLDTARRIDRLGYDHLWTWDHLNAIIGDPYQPIFEGPSMLAAWAVATERVRLGLLVGANTFRNPGLFAKQVETLDHISAGRAICGIGGAWFDLEHGAHGVDFGSGFGQRLDWMDESVSVIRRLLDGEEVSHEGARYRFDHLLHRPRPLQPHVPIMIGGSGERKTLRSIARHADMWNAMGSVEFVAHKDEVLREHCRVVGRDESEIERTLGIKLTIRDTEEAARRVWGEHLEANRSPYFEEDDVWLGTPRQIADRIRSFRAIGFSTYISEMPAPYDVETLERFIGEVPALVDG